MSGRMDNSADVYRELEDAYIEINMLRAQVDALTPPETLTQQFDPTRSGWNWPEPPFAVDFQTKEMIDLWDACDTAWTQLDQVSCCTVVMTPLTDACLYTYHLETAYGTFVGKPVVLPYAKPANENGYRPGDEQEQTPRPSIITPDMIGEVITPLVDMGEVAAHEAARAIKGWQGAEKDRPPVRDEGVARFLEGGGS